MPVVIIGHGLGGTKECGTGAVARDVTAAGWAGLAFDYRGFGDSDNIASKPQGFFHCLRTAEDFEAAVGFARQHQSLDGTRVVLYGFSMGGHSAAIAALRLQDQGTPIQGLMLSAPRMVPKLPVKWMGAMGADHWCRALYIMKSLGSYLFCCCRGRVVQHMTSLHDRKAIMPDSWCSWVIIPPGHNNELSTGTLFPMVFPSLQVYRLNRRFCTLETDVHLSVGIHDVRLATSPSRLRNMFANKPGKPLQYLEVPGEHISMLPIVNQAAYDKFKDTYIDPADTYVPEVYTNYILPGLHAFLKQH